MSVEQISTEGGTGAEHKHGIVQIDISNSFIQNGMSDSFLIVRISIQFVQRILE